MNSRQIDKYMEKEQWKDEVLNSLKGMKHAEPSAFLFTRIEAKLHLPAAMPQWQLSLATIVLALLLAANALLIFRNGNKAVQTVNQEYRISGFQSY